MNQRAPIVYRPPLIQDLDGEKLIVCGSSVLHWKGGGTFLNFLDHNLIKTLGGSIFLQDTSHPLNIWRQAMRKQAEARRHLPKNQGLISTAAVLNYFTVAHDFFVISDHTVMRDRLVKSLRHAHEFQGARYELMIASCLIRGGFTVQFSDEQNVSERHSDALAHHVRTNKSYHVEMKAKGREGLLGKPGIPISQEEMKRDASRLLRAALEKPATEERLIFIDMNLPTADLPAEKNQLMWQDDAVRSVKGVEAQRGKVAHDISGFVIFTNSPSHYVPSYEYYIGLETAFTGFNKPDFAIDMPLLDEGYPDIAELFKAFKTHDEIPDHFVTGTAVSCK